MKKISYYLLASLMILISTAQAKVTTAMEEYKPDYKYVGKTDINGTSFETICSDDYLVDVYLYLFKTKLDDAKNVLVLVNSNIENTDTDFEFGESNLILTNANLDQFKGRCQFKNKKHDIDAINMPYVDNFDTYIISNLVISNANGRYYNAEATIIGDNIIFSNNSINNSTDLYMFINSENNALFTNNKVYNNKPSAGIYIMSERNIGLVNNEFINNGNESPDPLVELYVGGDDQIMVDSNTFKENEGVLLYVDGQSAKVLYQNNKFLNNDNIFDDADLVIIRSDSIININNVFSNNKSQKNILNVKNINTALYKDNNFAYNGSINDLYIDQYKSAGVIFLNNAVNKILFNGNKSKVLSDQYIEIKDSYNIDENIKPITNLEDKIDTLFEKNTRSDLFERNTQSKDVYQLRNLLNPLNVIRNILPGSRNRNDDDDEDNNQSSNADLNNILGMLGQLSNGSSTNSGNNNSNNNQNSNSNNNSNNTQNTNENSSNGGILGSITQGINQIFKPIVDLVNNTNASISFISNSGANIDPGDVSFDIGVNSSSKPLYAYNYEITVGKNGVKEVNQLSKKEPDMFYRFKDTKLNTYADDYIVNIDIKNTSNKQIFFNKVLIKEYVGEPISKPVATNDNITMFNEANKALIEYLQEVYRPLERKIDPTSNLGVLINSQDNNIQMNQATQEQDNSFLESLIQTSLTNLQGANTPDLPTSNQNQQPTKPAVSPSDIWEGNFIISTQNCQDPYYINENQRSLLDILPFAGNVFSIGAGKTCSIQIMFKPKDQAGYHMDTIEIGTASLPDPVRQAINNVFGSLGDITFYNGLANIFIKVDGYAYNEKRMLIDVDDDRNNDEVAIRFYDGQLSNPLYKQQGTGSSGSSGIGELVNLLETANSYTDNTANLVQYLGNTPVAESEVVDPNLSILSDFDYFYLLPYFVDRYNNYNDKVTRKFPHNFIPYYKMRFKLSNLKTSEHVKLVHTLSINPKSKIKIYYENIYNGTFRDVTENFNIYLANSNSLVSPTVTAMEFYMDDGGFLDADGLTDGVLTVNALWVGVEGKDLILNKTLVKPDLSNLVPPAPEEERIKWGGLPVND